MFISVYTNKKLQSFLTNNKTCFQPYLTNYNIFLELYMKNYKTYPYPYLTTYKICLQHKQFGSKCPTRG